MNENTMLEKFAGDRRVFISIFNLKNDLTNIKLKLENKINSKLENYIQ